MRFLAAPRLRHRSERCRQGGFTLIEALVALALTAMLLAAIGRLIGASALTARRLEEHTDAMAAARLLTAGLPRGGTPLPRDQRGRLGGYLWQTRATPFFDGPQSRAQANFVPMRVEMRLRAPGGALYSFETVRLQSRGAP